MRCALIYEAHEFFKRELLENEFLSEMQSQSNQENRAEVESDISNDDDEDDTQEKNTSETEEDSDTSDSSTESLYQTKKNVKLMIEDACNSVDFQNVSGDSEFHGQVLKYVQEWDDWDPEDPVQKMIKRAIS